MALGKQKDGSQPSFWISTQNLAKTAGHPFYRKLNEILRKKGFDKFAEKKCARFYAEGKGRPGIPPGVYFRMLMAGYFEGIDSERGIAWRCSDSLALRSFLFFGLDEQTPDHSSLSRIRHRIDLETHEEIFTWVLKALSKEKLLEAKTLGIDATTLEANAAMRSIVRRDTGDNYVEYLTKLAKKSGVETPTREELAKFDKKRKKKKTSNDDWKNPHDPDAKITKMKDKRTHPSNKAEHAVDLDSGTVLSVTIQGANLGDTTTILETTAAAARVLCEIREDPETGDTLPEEPFREVVTDKGYHSSVVVTDLKKMDIRTYISEPDRGRQKWKGKRDQQSAVYANRRRIKGERGKRLLRKRGELVERSFAHIYDTGGMRRTHLRGHKNILKRLLIHVCGFNLGLLMRKLFGHGTPKGHRGLVGGLLGALLGLPHVSVRKINRYSTVILQKMIFCASHAAA